MVRGLTPGYTICSISPAGWSFQPVMAARPGYTATPAKSLLYICHISSRMSAATVHPSPQRTGAARSAAAVALDIQQAHSASRPQEPQQAAGAARRHPLPSTAGPQETPPSAITSGCSAAQVDTAPPDAGAGAAQPLDSLPPIVQPSTISTENAQPPTVSTSPSIYAYSCKFNNISRC